MAYVIVGMLAIKLAFGRVGTSATEQGALRTIAAPGADPLDPAAGARTVVSWLVGVFLIKAAIGFHPSKAVGLDGALGGVDHARGPFLLGLAAAGLVAFGTYSLSDARYRRI